MDPTRPEEDRVLGARARERPLRPGRRVLGLPLVRSRRLGPGSPPRPNGPRGLLGGQRTVPARGRRPRDGLRLHGRRAPDRGPRPDPLLRELNALERLARGRVPPAPAGARRPVRRAARCIPDSGRTEGPPAGHRPSPVGRHALHRRVRIGRRGPPPHRRHELGHRVGHGNPRRPRAVAARLLLVPDPPGAARRRDAFPPRGVQSGTGPKNSIQLPSGSRV